MTQLDLDELQRLADEATTGPWRGKEDQVESDRSWICDAASGLRPLARETANAAFIAAARTAVPALVGEVRQLRANLDEAAQIATRLWLNGCGTSSDYDKGAMFAALALARALGIDVSTVALVAVPAAGCA